MMPLMKNLNRFSAGAGHGFIGFLEVSAGFAT
jgi:hypothetical protein